MILFPALLQSSDKPALRFPDAELSYAQLASAAVGTVDAIGDADRVSVWADNTLDTAVSIVAALSAGIPAIPLNPRSGPRELDHILRDSAPSAVLASRTAELPSGFAGMRRITIDPRPVHSTFPQPRLSSEDPALIVYTSGTTGPPKGAVLPRRAISSNLDALATAWEWTESDVVCHALPLFHVHGLVVGTLGPLRRGGTAWHLGRFDPAVVAEALSGMATMLFGVPTMYHRLIDAAADPEIAAGLSAARLLVSGSAALPAAEHEQIRELTGQAVIERYGMSETIMICSTTISGRRPPGFVGAPLEGVSVSLRDDDGSEIPSDGETIGEVHVRGPNLMLAYLNQPDATAAAFASDGYFRTGDLAVRDVEGLVRLIGRRATDLIKSGGFKIGAGEIEAVLVDHPAVAEAAVTGISDPDLGERVCAWVVLRPGEQTDERELSTFVADALAPHKRPRTVHFVDSLPRNALGKVLKTELRARPR